MKTLKLKMFIAIFAISFVGCKKELDSLTTPVTSQNKGNQQLREGSEVGHVYTMSNLTSGNAVLDYIRDNSGKLTFSAAYPTGGNGTGGGLGNQGALALADENEGLFVVNAASNTISSFNIKSDGLTLKSTVNSGGLRPISITEYDGIVYVLNIGGNGNIAGFKYDDGILKPIANF
jgi:6-phosphogluconolactonase